MILEIKAVCGKWLVNGKPYKDLSFYEKSLLNNFFKEIKIEAEKFSDELKVTSDE